MAVQEARILRQHRALLGILEVRLERHDAGLLHQLEQLILQAQQLEIVVLRVPPEKNHLNCPTSALTIDIGVAMSSCPTAAPPMIRTSVGWNSTFRLPPSIM